MRTRRTTVLAVTAVALLAACSGGGSKSSSSSGTTSTTLPATTTTTVPPTDPLTGLPAPDPAIRARPALVVKIDNADGGGANSARPQVGLNQADVVFEELVEGSVTRLAAVFHSQDSDPVGPVRSARTSDVNILTALNKPLFAWSGANADFAEIIRNSALVDVGYSAASDAYQRRHEYGQVAPHDLFSSTPALFALAPAGAQPPPALFTFRSALAAVSATAKPIGSIHLDFGGGGGNAPVDWAFDATTGRFLRSQKGTPHVDAAGVQISAANVVVQFVGYHDTGYVDVAGTPVPEADVVGTGSCWILTGGKLVEGTWSKASPEAVTQYADATGAPIALTPGQTWVELPPVGGGTITG